jgi:uncharacterized membrane protein
MERKIDIGESLSLGWEKTKQYFWPLTGLLVAMIVLQVATNYIGDGQGFNYSAEPKEFSGTMMIGSLLSMVIGVIFSAAMIRMGLDILDDKYQGFTQSFSLPVSAYVNTFLGTVLYYIVVFLGFLLLIFPGLYLALRYQFYSEFIVDRNVGVFESFRLSAQATKGKKLSLFAFSLVIGIVNVIGLILLGVGLLATIPLTYLAYLAVYRVLSGPNTEPAA